MAGWAGGQRLIRQVRWEAPPRLQHHDVTGPEVRERPPHPLAVRIEAANGVRRGGHQVIAALHPEAHRRLRAVRQHRRHGRLSARFQQYGVARGERLHREQPARGGDAGPAGEAGVVREHGGGGGDGGAMDFGHGRPDSAERNAGAEPLLVGVHSGRLSGPTMGLRCEAVQSAEHG
jgi:hypothetical protein